MHEFSQCFPITITITITILLSTSLCPLPMNGWSHLLYKQCLYSNSHEVTLSVRFGATTYYRAKLCICIWTVVWHNHCHWAKSCICIRFQFKGLPHRALKHIFVWGSTYVAISSIHIKTSTSFVLWSRSILTFSTKPSLIGRFWEISRTWVL